MSRLADEFACPPDVQRVVCVSLSSFQSPIWTIDEYLFLDSRETRARDSFELSLVTESEAKKHEKTTTTTTRRWTLEFAERVLRERGLVEKAEKVTRPGGDRDGERERERDEEARGVLAHASSTT